MPSKVESRISYASDIKGMYVYCLEKEKDKRNLDHERDMVIDRQQQGSCIKPRSDMGWRYKKYIETWKSVVMFTVPSWRQTIKNTIALHAQYRNMF